MEELIKKIDFVVNTIDSQKKDLEIRYKLSTQNLSSLQSKKMATNQYHYDLENCNLKLTVLKAKIKKCDLYKKRCQAYQQFLKLFGSSDLISIEKEKYNFIKCFQEEAIHDLNSKIEEQIQRRIIENICGVASNLSEEKNKTINRRQDVFERFLNSDFIIDETKINTPYYLNYDTDALIETLYPKKERRKKAS